MKVVLQNLTKIFPSRDKKAGGEVVAVNDFTFEIPDGKLDSFPDDRLSAAKRELEEETGLRAEKMTYLGRIDPTPALINEKIHLYLAEGLSFGERELDEDEFLDVELIHLNELYKMVMSGEIKDAKTQVAVLKVFALRGEKFRT